MRSVAALFGVAIDRPTLRYRTVSGPYYIWGMIPVATPIEETLLFEAVISPNRSLSHRGKIRLFAVLAVLSIATGVRFWVLGAWPVAVFVVLELGLAAILFWVHTQSQRQTELLLLTNFSLRLIRTGSDGRRRETSLPLRWMTIELAERSGRVPALFVRCRGDRMELLQTEVASALGDTEKRELAKALAQAVQRLRNPIFDNFGLE